MTFKSPNLLPHQGLCLSLQDNILNVTLMEDLFWKPFPNVFILHILVCLKLIQELPRLCISCLSVFLAFSSLDTCKQRHQWVRTTDIIKNFSGVIFFWIMLVYCLHTSLGFNFSSCTSKKKKNQSCSWPFMDSFFFTSIFQRNNSSLILLFALFFHPVKFLSIIIVTGCVFIWATSHEWYFRLKDPGFNPWVSMSNYGTHTSQPGMCWCCVLNV